jgi:hypothetical protein
MVEVGLSWMCLRFEDSRYAGQVGNGIRLAWVGLSKFGEISGFIGSLVHQ